MQLAFLQLTYFFISYPCRRVPGRSPGVWLLSDALPQVVMVGNDNGDAAAPGATVPAVEAVKIFRTEGKKLSKDSRPFKNSQNSDPE